MKLLVIAVLTSNEARNAAVNTCGSAKSATPWNMDVPKAQGKPNAEHEQKKQRDAHHVKEKKTPSPDLHGNLLLCTV